MEEILGRLDARVRAGGGAGANPRRIKEAKGTGEAALLDIFPARFFRTLKILAGMWIRKQACRLGPLLEPRSSTRWLHYVEAATSRLLKGAKTKKTQQLQGAILGECSSRKRRF